MVKVVKREKDVGRWVVVEVVVGSSLVVEVVGDKPSFV
jgi:hypothetical protein